MHALRKFDIKTQTYVEVEYNGYKANRTAMPADLAQQVPYIRRALEAYRIPILELPGFEADDVIGTLARKAAEQGYSVFVVSSDKDMMQLVNDQVCVLNPPKDNLICDAAKVEEILGVPPERVVDVMALRGDSIDNIPGAPGIGDKGSVDLIQRFGTRRSLLDHAEEVETKTYRESLQNNRDAILLSKQLVTIDTQRSRRISSRRRCGRRSPTPRRSRAVHRTGIHHAGAGISDRERRVGETDYREAKLRRGPRSSPRARPSNGAALAIAIGVEAADEVDRQQKKRSETSRQRDEQLSLWRCARCRSRSVRDAKLQVAISARAGTRRWLLTLR